MKVLTSIMLGAALVAVAMPAGGTEKICKQARKLKLVKDCRACYANIAKPSKSELTEVGNWMVEQKAARNAEDYDVEWLKEYYADKK